MKRIIYIIFSLLFSLPHYGQYKKENKHFSITGSDSDILQIMYPKELEGKSTMAQFEILNESSLIKHCQNVFFKAIKELNKCDITMERLKTEYDSLKIESYITLYYTGNEEIRNISFHFSQFVINNILSEEDLEFIYKKLKNTIKIKLHTNEGHIYLDKYDSEWKTSYKKKIIPITEFYKEYSRKKGYRDHVIKLMSNKSTPAMMSIHSIEPITEKQTVGEISINRIETDSVISETIKMVLNQRKKYDALYHQLKYEYEKNKTISNIAIWYNGKGEIRHCSFYVSSDVLDNILVEKDFNAISTALKNLIIKVDDSPQNGYTAWGDYDPEWKSGIKYMSIPIIRFQNH